MKRYTLTHHDMTKVANESEPPIILESFDISAIEKICGCKVSPEGAWSDLVAEVHESGNPIPYTFYRVK